MGACEVQQGKSTVEVTDKYSTDVPLKTKKFKYFNNKYECYFLP